MHVQSSETFTNDAGEIARRRLLSHRGEPLFYADWDRALFLHCEVDAAALQRDVPFPLDLREGRAYVSLVAFTLRGLRLRLGGPLGRWLFKPIATHEFLNVRTYVRHHGEPGIFFLGEWLSNSLSVRLGPRTFGLPYRAARMKYLHEHESGKLAGTVAGAGTSTSLQYEAAIEPAAGFAACASGSLDEFLLERYTAFTAHGGRHRFFRIWHQPWLQARADFGIREAGLLTGTWEWFDRVNWIGGNYSPGVRDVWMGRPHRLANPQTERRSGVRSAYFEFP